MAKKKVRKKSKVKAKTKKKAKRISAKKKSPKKAASSPLTPYVKEALDKGYNKADVKKALLAKGWDGRDIDLAFKLLNKKVLEKKPKKVGGKKAKKEKKEEKKKKVKLGRVHSGVQGFDKLISGGFEENSVNLLVGNSGSGKTIFAVQFLIEAMNKGECCLYITFEEKKDEFYSNMMKFGWDLDKYEKEGKFVFLEYSPEKIKSMLEEGGGTVESIIIKNKITRLVIDSVSSFALLFSDELAKREAALQLFDIIRNWEATSILTLQEDPAFREGGSSTSMEFEADSIIFLYFVRVKNSRRRLIEILKMRGTRHSTELHTFEISKVGVHIGGRINVPNLK
ncbi:MAG: ATPase domain-containing protein [archaeon]